MKIKDQLNHSKKAYSIIISVGIIGFLLILSTGVFKLVLNEMKDNRAMGNSIKAYAGAESGAELALLQIKENGYGYYDIIDESLNDRSIILSQNPLDKSKYNGNRDSLIFYDIGSKTKLYDGEISPLDQDIIPLFFIDSGGNEKKITDLNFSVSSGNIFDIAWNIVGKNRGISGKGDIINGIEKTFYDSSKSFTLNSSVNINSFLSNSEANYLVLYNAGSSSIEYSLSSVDFFTKPKTEIISSSRVGGYKQNIRTNLDNTRYLNILKYSIYSN